jgi:uncharacterized delta-60 repeat protein
MVFWSAHAASQGLAVDSFFGDYGRVSTDIDPETGDEVNSVVCQLDGKIVAAGISLIPNSDTRAALVRYHPNGRVDSGFGTNGRVLFLYGNSGMTIGHSVATQKLSASAPENIILASHYLDGAVTSLALSRYLPTGLPDMSFGNGGVATLYDAWAFKVATNAGGQLLVAGQKFLPKLGLFRFTQNGMLDPTFGDNGYASIQSTFYGFSAAMAVQNDGRILIGGFVYGPSISKQDVGLVRFLPDGKPDSSFGINGIVLTSPDTNEAELNSIALQADGKILAAGTSDTGTGPHFLLIRYLPNGTVDSSFGLNGIVRTNFSNNECRASEVLVQNDTKIYAVGYAQPASPNQSKVFAIARYHSNGTLDSTFGVYGKDTSRVDYSSAALAATIAPDLKVIAAGWGLSITSTSVSNNFGLIRYLSGLEVGVVDLTVSAPPVLYPNPVKQSATLSYELRKEEVVTLRLLDMSGRTVQTFFSCKLRHAGRHEDRLQFDNSVTTGGYLLQLAGSGGSYTIKLHVHQ